MLPRAERGSMNASDWRSCALSRPRVGITGISDTSGCACERLRYRLVGSITGSNTLRLDTAAEGLEPMQMEHVSALSS
jgi:hypothetical protein